MAKKANGKEEKVIRFGPRKMLYLRVSELPRLRFPSDVWLGQPGTVNKAVSRSDNGRMNWDQAPAKLTLSVGTRAK